MRRPNMLLIVVDQMAHDVIRQLGHPTVLTPNLDKLVRGGVAFTNAYCNSPICVSSRTALMTGTLVRRNRAFDNGSEFPASTPTFVHALNHVGYRTVLAGKMHFIGPDQLHGFQERLTTDLSPAGFELTPDWRLGPHANPGTSVARLRYPPVRPWSLQLAYDDEVLHAARVHLRQLREDDAPFFMCASFTHPHDPFLVPQAFWDQYAGAPVPAPAAGAEPLDEMHPYNQWIQIHHEVDRLPLEEAEVLQARRAYYAAVTYVDHLVGQLLAELERLAFENTVVMFTSDHGEMLGEHGMWFKRTFYDGATKVPLVIAAPDLFAPARRSEVVSLVDVTATLLDLAGARDAAPLESDGSSLKPLLSGSTAAWPNRAVSEYFSEGTVQPMMMVRSGRHKFVYVHEHPPLLFDLQTDPHEQHDLASLAEHQKVCEALQTDLLGNLDVSALRADIMRSQQERLLIAGAARTSALWKYQTRRDASQLYQRPKA